MSDEEHDKAVQNIDPIHVPKRPYRPNHVSLDRRVVYFGACLLLLGYCALSIATDNFFLYIPGRRGGSVKVHLHGFSIFIACLAMVSACTSLLAVVIDHYDKRNNEATYQRVSRVALLAAVVLVVLAVLSDVLIFKKGEYKSKRHTWMPAGANQSLNPTSTPPGGRPSGAAAD